MKFFVNLPVEREISKAFCRYPMTLNWGSETSLETPTDPAPAFHLYRMSDIVYPTKRELFLICEIFEI